MIPIIYYNLPILYNDIYVESYRITALFFEMEDQLIENFSLFYL